MAPQIQLTETEATLRGLLLDASQYISETEHVVRPQLRFTGGWVRDKLLGSQSHDIDVGIDTMTGEKFGLGMKRFLEDRARSEKYDESIVHRISKIEANPDKSKHLETATTHILGMDIDLVNLRKETYTKESRNPQIEPATPEEDALRRDATVNALFYNLQTEEVEDFTQRGIQDMAAKIIRTPLDPYQTFEDDPLRILRCIRFATRLGYRIDEAALACMGNEAIAESLRVKISRERVGIEIEKTLKGPDPCTALRILDQQHLYETIFTNPEKPDIRPQDKANWSRAYAFLSEILQPDAGPDLQKIKTLLLRTTDEIYTAWLLCSLLPWGQQPWVEPLKLNSRPKRIFPAAAVAAREGLKLENKLLETIITSIDHFDEVNAMVNPNTSNPAHQSSSDWSHAGDIVDAAHREKLGMTMRKWGPHWREVFMYALLVNVQKMDDPSRYLSALNARLLQLSELNLLDVCEMKPLVNGKELMTALNRPSGTWLTGALDTVIRWQLRNPESRDREKLLGDIRVGLESAD